MTKNEALKLAFEALERSVATCFDQRSHDEVMGRPEHFVNKAITALRLAIDAQNMASESTYKEALAQPEQEPVAFASHGVVNWIADKQFQHEANLYIAPQRTWVGLTEEEMMDAIYAPVTPMERGRRVEAKLKQKNTRGQK